MGISSSVGLISGLETESIIKSVMELERRPITNLQQQQAVFQAKISSFGMVKSTLSNLRTSLSPLMLSSTFSPGYSASSSNEDLLGVSIANSNTVSEGTYRISVDQLATAAQMTSNAYAENDSTVGAGTIHFQVGDGNKQSVVIDSDSQSLDDIATAINDANTDVAASVIRVAENDYRLSLTAKETGYDISYTYQEEGLTFSTTTQAGTTVGETAESQGFASDSTALGLTGTLSVNGTDINFTGTETLNDIQASVDAIADISAQINFDAESGSYSLEVENSVAGSAVDITFGDSDAGTGLSGMIDSGATIAAKKAVLSINNIAVERDTNTIDDLITGVTLNLNDEDPATTLTVSITSNYNDVSEKISSFVESFNSLVSTLDSLQNYDSETETAGNLLGDSTTNVLRSGIRRMIFSSVSGVSSDVDTLSKLGVEIEESGLMSFDSSVFLSAMENNPDDVTSFFKDDTSSTQGFAVRFGEFLDGYLTSDSGILAAKIDGYNSSSARLDTNIEAIENRLDKREENMRKEYANLEQVLSAYTSTASYLSTQLSSLTNMTNSFYK